MDNLLLVDFNDLFVIAVGVSMAYIVIENHRGGHSFFSILSKFTNIVQSLVLDSKTRPQQNEEAVITKIQYYIGTDLLKETTKGALDLVCRNAMDVMNDVEELESWFKGKMAFHTKTDYLNVISCDSFIYGLFVLFVGALQNKCNFVYDGLLEWMLFFVLLGLFHCLIYERLEIENRFTRITQPNIFLHCLLAVGFLFIGIVCREMPFFHFSNGCLAVLSVIASFIGFITYLFTTLVANILLMIVMLIKILNLKIDKKVKDQKDNISRYRKELDLIDAKIKNEKLDSEFTVTGGETATSDG